MNKKTVIYILGCVLVFVSAFMLLPWFVSLIYSEETGKYFNKSKEKTEKISKHEPSQNVAMVNI